MEPEMDNEPEKSEDRLAETEATGSGFDVGKYRVAKSNVLGSGQDNGKKGSVLNGQGKKEYIKQLGKEIPNEAERHLTELLMNIGVWNPVKYAKKICGKTELTKEKLVARHNTLLNALQEYDRNQLELIELTQEAEQLYNLANSGMAQLKKEISDLEKKIQGSSGENFTSVQKEICGKNYLYLDLEVTYGLAESKFNEYLTKLETHKSSRALCLDIMNGVKKQLDELGQIVIVAEPEENAISQAEPTFNDIELSRNQSIKQNNINHATAQYRTGVMKQIYDRLLNKGRATKPKNLDTAEVDQMRTLVRQESDRTHAEFERKYDKWKTDPMAYIR